MLHCAHLFPFVHGRIKGTRMQSASAGALSRKITVISIDNLKKEKNITKRQAPFANRVVSSIRFSGYSCNVEINKRFNLIDASLIQKPKRDNIIEVVADTFVLLVARFHLVLGLVKNIAEQWEFLFTEI